MNQKISFGLQGRRFSFLKRATEFPDQNRFNYLKNDFIYYL